jgi:tetratricopeptide (TPR) repeat protein/protein involved in polysaccharide export with SLBB domain
MVSSRRQTGTILRSQIAVYRCIACLTVLLFASPLNAQKVGDKLIVVAESAAKLKMGSSTVDTVARGECVTVESVGNDHFRLLYGDQYLWIAKRDVMVIDEAIRHFTQAITKKPRATDYFGRGNAWSEKGDHDKAIADFSEAIRLDPKHDRSFALRGYAYMVKGDASGDKALYSKAAADFSKAIDLDSNDAVVRFYRASVYVRAGDSDRAMADLAEAIRLDANYADAYAARGDVYRLKNDFDKAIADYDEALRLDSKNAEACASRAACYDWKGDFDKAIADGSEAIRLKPTCYQAFSLRGYAYASKVDITGDTDLWSKAIADFTKAIGLNANDSGVWYNRGHAYLKTGEFDKAIADCTEAVRLDPEDPQSYLWRGCAHGAKGDFDRAIADYSEAIRRNPKCVEAYSYRGDAWCCNGEYDKAVADYSEVLRLDPSHAVARVRRAWVERRKKHLARATGDPNSTAARAKSSCDHEFQANVLLESGNNERGLAELQRAVRLNPKDQAAKFEPWPKTPLSPRALRHGQRQLAQMLKDRPAMAKYGKSAEPLYEWAIRKFAGEDLGEEVFWDSADPQMPLNGACSLRTDDMPGRIWIRETYGSGENVGKRRPFGDIWGTAVFELYNISNASDFEKLDRKASEDTVLKAQYVVRRIEIECQAQEKTRSFYINVFLPWARQHHIVTQPSNWYIARRSDPSEDLIQCFDRDDPSWQAYEQCHGASYDYVMAAARAAKEKKAVERRGKDLLANQAASANDPGRVAASPEDSPEDSPKDGRRAAADRRIEPLDVLTVWVRGTPVGWPIQERRLVEPDGSLTLGALYGRVRVKGSTLEEAEKSITKHLTEVLNAPADKSIREYLPKPLGAPDVEVLAAGRATQWSAERPRSPYRIRPNDLLRIEAAGVLVDAPIADDYRVDADGRVHLGKVYGNVAVKGLTPEEAEKAIAEHLGEMFYRPEVSVTLAGWKREPEKPIPRKPSGAVDQMKAKQAGK